MSALNLGDRVRYCGELATILPDCRGTVTEPDPQHPTCYSIMWDGNTTPVPVHVSNLEREVTT